MFRNIFRKVLDRALERCLDIGSARASRVVVAEPRRGLLSCSFASWPPPRSPHRGKFAAGDLWYFGFFFFRMLESIDIWHVLTQGPHIPTSSRGLTGPRLARRAHPRPLSHLRGDHPPAAHAYLHTRDLHVSRFGLRCGARHLAPHCPPFGQDHAHLCSLFSIS